jgi:UDP-N-acetyl-D-galactosamine dehydrogenase
VTGHCIINATKPGHTYRAEKAGYHPQVILSGRRINDGMGQWVAQETVRALTLRGCTNAIVTVLGMTFKEDVPDIRNSKVIDIVRELERFGIRVQVADPLALAGETKHEYGVTLTPLQNLQPADAVVLAVAHADYVGSGWRLMVQLLKGGKGTVIDVKSRLDRGAKPEGIDLWRL